jgi:ABC-type xylose transport system permease subunit
MMVNSGVGAAPALLIGLVLGFVAGGLNGILITLIKLPPFIATLGTMSVYQGLAYVVTDGQPVYNVPQSFVLMLNSYIAGVPIVVVIVIVVALLAWLLLRRTVFGQNVIATGGSEETAWLSGVRVARVKILVYGLSGALAALAGLVVVARISAAQSEAGAPYLLTAIAAAVIGGANPDGRRGPHRRHPGRRAHPGRSHQRPRPAQRAQLLRADRHRPRRGHRGRHRPGQQARLVGTEPRPSRRAHAGRPSPSAAEATVGSRTGE